MEGDVSAGAIGEVYSWEGQFLGRGYLNPHSQIIFRLLTHKKKEFNIDFFRERIAFGEQSGILSDRMILDPGIGFGKSLEEEHNLIILKHLRKFTALGKPLLIGTSRKAFIGRILGLPPQEREEGTMATVAIAIFNGANIVRVHEVNRMRRVVQTADALARSTPQNPD